MSKTLLSFVFLLSLLSPTLTLAEDKGDAAPESDWYSPKVAKQELVNPATDGLECTASKWEELRREFAKTHGLTSVAHVNSIRSADSPTERTTECKKDGEFFLFAMARGCARLVVETPQCLLAGIGDAAGDRQSTDTVQLCAVPFCEADGNTAGFPLFEHVFIRLNVPGCVGSNINFEPARGNICGDTGSIRTTDPRDTPGTNCHSVTVHSLPGTEGATDCGRATIVGCMAQKLKDFAPDYCVLGTNCGDISNFLLRCAGFSPRVQFNFNFLGNEGLNPSIAPTPRPNDDPNHPGPGKPPGGCCTAPIEPGTVIPPDKLCAILKAECIPCPVGECFNAGVGKCAPSDIGGNSGDRICGCAGGTGIPDPITRECHCPAGSHMENVVGAQVCRCDDERRELVDNSCKCKDRQFERDGMCVCPSEGDRTVWDPRVNHGWCNCVGGANPVFDTPGPAICACIGEGTRSHWDPELHRCVCNPGYNVPTVPRAPNDPAIICCAPGEIPNENNTNCIAGTPLSCRVPGPGCEVSGTGGIR